MKKKNYKIYDNTGTEVKSFDLFTDFVSYLESLDSLPRKIDTVESSESTKPKIILRKNGEIRKSESPSTFTEDTLRKLWKI